MKHVPSLLPNSTSLINDLSGQKFSPHCFLVTLDVSSLYTNISHTDAIDTIHAIFSQPSDIPHCPPLSILISLLSFVLNNNIFTFNQEIFLQTYGVAMGMKLAPALATLFLHLLEDSYISNSVHIPVFYR